jgi:uncharacterized membrane protein
MVRYRAYHLAYRTVAVFLLIAWISYNLFGVLGINYTPPGVLLFCTLVFISTLPTIIIAWQESESTLCM